MASLVAASLAFALLAPNSLPRHADAHDERGARAGASFSDVHEPARAASSSPLVLEGHVLTPDGRAASNTVVVSSAGGQVVTDSSGSFRLVVEIPRDADALQVTAVQSGSASLLASTVVAVPPAGIFASPVVLRLEASGSCLPSWLPTFGAMTGTNGNVYALAAFDDGSGPALFVGGDFTSPVHGIAKWDGASWSEVAGGVGGLVGGTVFCFAVYDDGSGGGPALYVGGEFETAGSSVVAHHIAKWDGSAWSSLGSGVSGGTATTAVYALAVFDDGVRGPSLFAGGRFTNAGGVPMTRYIARWDGASWSSLQGAGMDAQVQALAVFDEGGGGALYAGGQFTTSGGAATNRIAKWNGVTWAPVGGGMNGTVFSLASFDDGSGAGSRLYAGGEFTAAGGVATNCVAKWNGASWSPLGEGMADPGVPVVNALKVYDDGAGGGAELYATGWFTLAGGTPVNHVARWDGSAWSPVGAGLGSTGRALAAFDDGSGGGVSLYAGGHFSTAGGATVDSIAKWNGASWSPIADVEPLSSTVACLTTFDDGSGAGPELYAGGAFFNAGDIVLNFIGKWDGKTWFPLSSGLNGQATVLTTYDDGSGGGPALYVGGGFSLAGGVPVSNIAKWDGASWSPLGNGLSHAPLALCVFDDGSGGGPALYVGGYFSDVRRWNGSSWSSLGPLGVGVLDLAVFDDGLGGGPALYAGGGFSGTVARWNGTAWGTVGGGTDGEVESLAVYDDGGGGGPALYAGGTFLVAGGVSARRVARWDGTSWSALGSGLDGTAISLAALDDGSAAGPVLYVGGYFGTAGGIAAKNVARWDGSAWSPLGPGVNDVVYVVEGLEPAASSGPALYAGGRFEISPAGDSFLAKWGCAPAGVGTPYCFGDGSGTACPCGNPGGAGEGCANSSGMGAVLSGSGSSSASADDLTLHAVQLLPNQSALLFAAENRVNGGSGNPFGDGLRCASFGVRRFSIEVPSATGAADWGPGLGATGGWSAGDTRRFQVWYRDPTGSPCGSHFNLSNGFEVQFGS